MKSLEKFEFTTWDGPFSEEEKKKALLSLESGKVLFFPHLPFGLKEDEKKFLNTQMVDPKSKNVSFNYRTDTLAGTLYTLQEAEKLKNMIKRYSATCQLFVETLMPAYRSHLIRAKTSFRPVEIQGRKSSYRKDDTRLHVDAFPSNPTKGERILRLFTNINPEGKPRVWRVGEPFEQVVEKMGPKVTPPLFGHAHLMKFLKITKSLRTPYDHTMLQIHNLMKKDEEYQLTVSQEEIHFPAGSSWMVYTDQVSHAAMSGQYVLEQTFHLPVRGNQHHTLAPLKVLERYFEKTLL